MMRTWRVRRLSKKLSTGAYEAVRSAIGCFSACACLHGTLCETLLTCYSRICVALGAIGIQLILVV